MTINKLKSFLSVFDAEDEEQRKKDFIQALLTGLNKFDDLDKVEILKEVKTQVSNQIEIDKILSEQRFLQTELANDKLKLV
ncbi:hypothetical protein Phi10:1_gp013 [Cellulophaga phage phi10:1]|uniref:Uncharacterized protein n=2 Tax=Assiduviridae TaxID=2946156 RepID=R9ZYF2_9CAUD|nr:hypothetical protein Phi10:1_gp013 [Cellulophaga phage phi10:1]YP_010357521.1 hypothetical protein M1M31_gp79 [Cellulophaga phage Nekkels_1]AGO48354.1 hypothetical protein Phi10:1_gp013 [Cellulophaga phage phi10:1]QQO97084.1 hypothetical protein Nekkels1_79 [Cellulophaga phage Nekkels_1]